LTVCLFIVTFIIFLMLEILDLIKVRYSAVKNEIFLILYSYFLILAYLIVIIALLFSFGI